MPDAPETFDALAYEDALPLGFMALDALPDGPVLAAYNAENLEVLVADASLDKKPHLRDKLADEDQALVDELQRLEFKLNVLIQLVSRLLRRDAELPPIRAWRLNADGIEWHETGAPPVLGTAGIVTLHVSRHFPQPLQLPGRVVGTHEDPQRRWVQVAFEGLAPPVHELLAKLVFRHHRRAIAGSRATSPGESGS